MDNELKDELKDVPKYILDCPLVFHWCKFKGETYFGGLNYDRSINAKRPMIDLFYCATTACNHMVLKTVAWDINKFEIIEEI